MGTYEVTQGGGGRGGRVGVKSCVHQRNSKTSIDLSKFESEFEPTWVMNDPCYMKEPYYMKVYIVNAVPVA